MILLGMIIGILLAYLVTTQVLLDDEERDEDNGE